MFKFPDSAEELMHMPDQFFNWSTRPTPIGNWKTLEEMQLRTRFYEDLTSQSQTSSSTDVLEGLTAHDGIASQPPASTSDITSKTEHMLHEVLPGSAKTDPHKPLTAESP